MSLSTSSTWLQCLYPDCFGTFGSPQPARGHLCSLVLAVGARQWTGSHLDTTLLLQSLFANDFFLSKTLVLASSQSGSDSEVIFHNVYLSLYRVAVACSEWPTATAHVICSLFEVDKLLTKEFFTQIISSSQSKPKVYCTACLQRFNCTIGYVPITSGM